MCWWERKKRGRREEINMGGRRRRIGKRLVSHGLGPEKKYTGLAAGVGLAFTRYWFNTSTASLDIHEREWRIEREGRSNLAR